MADNLSPIKIGGAAPFTYELSITGALTVLVGAIRLPIHRSITIANVRVMVNTAPTGAAAIFDVNKNGVTLFTTQGNRPTVAVSTNADNASVPDITTAVAGDYITVDIDQIGSTVAGSNAVLVIEYF